jgi:transcriptional regulator with XRE-family HTH domain
METKQASRHLGRKIGRIRELLGVKQETLADKLGITQQAVSKLEQSEELEAPTLERIAKALGTSPEAIKNFNEDSAINFVNTFHDQSISHVIGNFGSYNFNPVDKWLEALEENKRLYEALLKSEREKIAMLEKMLNKS